MPERAREGDRWNMSSARWFTLIGAVFALAFSPATNWLAVGGFDGTLRLYDYMATSNQLIRAFVPVPIKSTTMQTASK